MWSAKGGHRDREKDLEVTDDTIWRIYSMTKPITVDRRHDALRRGSLRSQRRRRSMDRGVEGAARVGRRHGRKPLHGARRSNRCACITSQPDERTHVRVSTHPSDRRDLSQQGLRLRLRARRRPRPGRARLVLEPTGLPTRERMELFGLVRRARSADRDLERTELRVVPPGPDPRSARP